MLAGLAGRACVEISAVLAGCIAKLLPLSLSIIGGCNMGAALSLEHVKSHSAYYLSGLRNHTVIRYMMLSNAGPSQLHVQNLYISV